MPQSTGESFPDHNRPDDAPGHHTRKNTHIPQLENCCRLSCLQNDKNLFRDVRLIDDNPSREHHKIGVIYVARGQDKQNHILSNEACSEAYQKFVNTIGWKINMYEHAGYNGGMKDPKTTGEFSQYYGTSCYEIMWHVPTMMPSSEIDPQQVNKKRHVANDYVNVIWTDHHRDYLPMTISTYLTIVHVVVYPMSRMKGVYRIATHHKQQYKGLSTFGPLLDGMTVPECVMAPLVRLTALNSSRTVQQTRKKHWAPMTTRQRYLDKIVEQYQLKDSNPSANQAQFSRSMLYSLFREKPPNNLDYWYEMKQKWRRSNSTYEQFMKDFVQGSGQSSS